MAVDITFNGEYHIVECLLEGDEEILSIYSGNGDYLVCEAYDLDLVESYLSKAIAGSSVDGFQVRIDRSSKDVDFDLEGEGISLQCTTNDLDLVPQLFIKALESVADHRGKTDDDIDTIGE